MRSLPQLGSMENKMVEGSSPRHLVIEIRYFSSSMQKDELVKL